MGRHLTPVLAGLISVTVTAGVIGTTALTAAPARAANPAQAESLGLTAASGAAKTQPRWYTQDGTGSVEDLQAIDVTLSADGESFWSRKPRPVATTTTLTASPDPVAAGATVTLTATVTAADGSVPRGEVAFLVGFSLVFVAPVNASGVATATTTFAASGPNPRTVPLTAWFFGLIGSYAGSVGRGSETVNPTGTQGGGNTVPITVTVPRHGAFTVTITPGTVILSAPNRVAAKGTLLDITVTDLRTSHPGWSVSGQESSFIGTGVAAGHTISGNQLGWTPYIVSGHPRGWTPYLVVFRRGVTPGPPVAPADPGLGTTAALLASAEEGAGFGTYVLSASVVLDIPPATAGGPYGGSLTITAVEAAP